VVHHLADVGHRRLLREEVPRRGAQHLLLFAEPEIHRVVLLDEARYTTPRSRSAATSPAVRPSFARTSSVWAPNSAGGVRSAGGVAESLSGLPSVRRRSP